MSSAVKIIVATMVFFIVAALLLSVVQPRVLGFGDEAGNTLSNTFNIIEGILPW